jgi:hypothetical protein
MDLIKRGPDGKFLPREHYEEPAPSLFAQAVAAAIAKFEAVEPGPIEVRELTRRAHYQYPELRSYEPAEEEAGRKDFATRVTACCDVLKRFQSLVMAERDTEGMAALPNFINAALGALATVDWRELEKQCTLLINEGNRLSYPPPPKPFDAWMRLATALGWDADEREWIATDLLRDGSSIIALNTRGFDTSSQRHVDRQALRDSWAPHEEPWRGRFYERLPRIPG